jgi:hypothetical protein
MPYNVPAVTVTATKMADGTVQLIFTHAAGDIRYGIVIPAANFTSLNTTVNGGSAGATLSFTYAEDANQGDYPQGFVQGA